MDVCYLQVSSLDDSMIFHLASLPDDDYQLFLNIVQLFQKCEMKGQKLSKATRKKIETEMLDCKGLHFKPLRGIQPVVRSKFLQQLSSKEISFTELASMCRQHKHLEEVKKQFQKYLNLPSWEEATRRYAGYATEEKLKPYLGLHFKQGSVPPSFASFCEQAKKATAARSIRSQDETLPEGIVCVKLKASSVIIAKNNISEVAAGANSEFSDAVLQSGGIALTIIYPPKVFNFVFK